MLCPAMLVTCSTVIPRRQASHVILAQTQTPSELDLPLIVGASHATHKPSKDKAWLEKRPRFQLHFIPSSACWLNRVERFFRDPSHNAIERGVFPACPNASPLSKPMSSITTAIANRFRLPKAH